MFGIQQDRPVNSVFGGQGPVSESSLLHLHASSQHPGNRKCEKDGNFNFLGQEDEPLMGDENRNQLRPRGQNPQGREHILPSTHFGLTPLSPLSRLPCWSPLEPLPEIEISEEGCGRVPPEGAEGKMEEEMSRGMEEKVEEEVERGDKEVEGAEEVEEVGWEESDSEFEFSYRSNDSSSLSTESEEGERELGSIWDHVCMGGVKGEEQPEGNSMTNAASMVFCEKRGRCGDGRSQVERARKSRGAKGPVEEGSSDSDTDPCSDVPELLEAVWTLRDRERFKAREMERHQVQLTMYRRLALIRWVRSLQDRVQEQQNRLQSSFDVILTHRKELLRMGTGIGVATATATQS